GDTLTGALARAAGETVGDYAIGQGSLAASGNYALSFTTGSTFGITPRAITITADAAQSKIYGNVDPTLNYTIGGLGLVFGDTLTGALARAAGETVGDYAIGQGSLAASGNYALSFTTEAFTVTRRPLVITADDKSRIYGEVNPLTGSATGDNLVAGDTIDWVEIFSAATAASNVGRYDALASNASGIGLDNYDITYVTNVGGLEVTRRPITVRADDIRVLQGQSDPLLAWSLVAGILAPFDTFDTIFMGHLVREPGQAVGRYAITRGTLAVVGNYDLVDFAAGSLTIAPAMITRSVPLERGGNANVWLTDTLASKPWDDEDEQSDCTAGVADGECASLSGLDRQYFGDHIRWQN
ncbi:MBG domain-containing protein, partial [Devosia sp.]|uniref:MBG domain-containing protein n=1 Tax=Devosia sp. TaxID=1871048 RepID=UPI001AD13048